MGKMRSWALPLDQNKTLPKYRPEREESFSISANWVIHASTDESASALKSAQIQVKKKKKKKR